MLDKAELKEELLSKANLWKTQRTSIRQHNLPEELIRTNANEFRYTHSVISLPFKVINFLFTQRNNKKQHFWCTVISD